MLRLNKNQAGGEIIRDDGVPIGRVRIHKYTREHREAESFLCRKCVGCDKQLRIDVAFVLVNGRLFHLSCAKAGL